VAQEVRDKIEIIPVSTVKEILEKTGVLSEEKTEPGVYSI
jgi:predicted ATP-dependent protease